MNNLQKITINRLLNSGYVEISNDFMNPYIRVFQKGNFTCKVSFSGAVIPIS